MKQLRVQSLKYLKRCRMWYYRTFIYRLNYLGSDSYIARNVHIRSRTTWIGSESFIGANCWLSVDNLKIGNFVMIAGKSAVIGGDHQFATPSIPTIRCPRDRSRPVVIMDDVWIGFGVIVLHGVTIGEGAIIGAGSLVTKDIPPYSIAVGSPCKVVRARFTHDERIKHERALHEIRDKMNYQTTDQFN